MTTEDQYKRQAQIMNRFLDDVLRMSVEQKVITANQRDQIIDVANGPWNPPIEEGK